MPSEAVRTSSIQIPGARVVIAGAPRAGKTMLAAHRFPQHIVRNTDELVGVLEWSEASAEVATWMNDAGPWAIEGVATVRALRKWLKANEAGKPCDTLVWMSEMLVTPTPGQAALAKGCATVWREVRPLVEARGVAVIEWAWQA